MHDGLAQFNQQLLQLLLFGKLIVDDGVIKNPGYLEIPSK